MDHFCFLCLVFVMFSVLFIVALRSPAGKGLTSWRVCGVLLCACLFPMWCPVSGAVLDCMIPDLCLLSYFVVSPDLSLLIHIKQRCRRGSD